MTRKVRGVTGERRCLATLTDTQSKMVGPMRNRGIEHHESQWRDNGNGTGSWEVHVQCELLGSVKVDVPSRSREAMTPTQERCLQMVRDLGSDLKTDLIEALRTYAIAYLGDEPEDEDLHFTCDFASVPYLENSRSAYVYLVAYSGVDEEHGVCFLLRDGDVLGCCHGDESLQFDGWDNTEALDELADERL